MKWTLWWNKKWVFSYQQYLYILHTVKKVQHIMKKKKLFLWQVAYLNFSFVIVTLSLCSCNILTEFKSQTSLPNTRMLLVYLSFGWFLHGKILKRTESPSLGCIGIKVSFHVAKHWAHTPYSLSSTWEMQYEPHHEKTCLRGLRPGKTHTSLHSHRSWIEAWNFGYRN